MSPVESNLIDGVLVVLVEKVEELSAARLRIEELKSQAACRRKEVDVSP